MDGQAVIGWIAAAIAVVAAIYTRAQARGVRDQVDEMRRGNSLTERSVLLEEERHQRELDQEEAARHGSQAAEIRVTGPWAFAGDVSALHIENRGQHDARHVGLEFVAGTAGLPLFAIAHNGQVSHDPGTTRPGKHDTLMLRATARERWPIEVAVTWTDGNGTHHERQIVEYGEQ